MEYDYDMQFVNDLGNGCHTLSSDGLTLTSTLRDDCHYLLTASR
ncbi:MAG: hypothetical protein ACLU9S_13365 [Oscillospiraceae bacterium]